MHTLGTLMGLLLATNTAEAARQADPHEQDPCSFEGLLPGAGSESLQSAEALNLFAYEPGYGKAATSAEAISLAHADAEARLLARLSCAEVAPGASAYCDQVRASVVAYRGNTRQVHKKTWEACATAAVPDATMGLLEQAGATLDAEMAALGAELTAAASGGPIYLMTTVWESGCAAGTVGADVSARLRGAFSRLPQKPTLLTGVAKAPADLRRVRLVLDEQRGTVLVSASILDGDCATERPVGSLGFPAQLLGVAAGDLGRCATDALLGTTAWGSCAGALQVEVDLPTMLDGRVGVYCPGEVVEPVVRVSQPARVQVYAVNAKGEAWLYFPGEGQSDLVESELSLGPQDVVYDPTTGEERLVAVAVPADGTFGATRAWQGWCKAPGTWQDDWIPAGAASVGANFLVLPPGQGACADGPRTLPVHSSPPRCGG